MEEHQHPFVGSPTTSRFPPPNLHRRNISRSPTRNRLSVTDDIFTDFSPTRILEAFINPTGRLKASIDAASQTDRTFGIRAAHASKNIQEWVRELEEWEWPTEGGASMGFEVPPGKRRKLSNGGHVPQNGGRVYQEEPEYIGSLPAPTVLEYESRVDQIHTELEDLHVEEIKRHVLETHFTPSRPSSSSSNASSSILSSYTKMEDFTAIVTATVLKALPNVSKLMHLMDVWGVRLSVLQKVPRLLRRLEEGEVALRSGWAAIRIGANPSKDNLDEEALTRETFEIMRNVLQDKVTTSGRDLDFMLDTLEGREDTLPDSWLDRMEAIEHDYGEWVVAGDRKVREGEWAKMAKMRKEREEEARRMAEETARIEAENDARAAEAEAQRLSAEKRAYDAEVARLKAERDAQQALAEAERLKLEKEAQEELGRLKAEEDARELARMKVQEAERARLEAEKAGSLEEEATRLAEERRIQEDAARLRAEKLAADAELARQKAEEAEAIRLREENEAREEVRRLETLAVTAAAELARRKSEEAENVRLRLELEKQEAAAETIRIENERKLQEFEANQVREEQKAREIAAENARLAEERQIQAAETERVRKAQDDELAAAAKLEHERQIQEVKAQRLHQEQQVELAAKLEEERQLRAKKLARQEAKAREEAAKKSKLEEELKLQEVERLHKERELLAEKLKQQRLQEVEATRLREEKKAQEVEAEAKRFEEELRAHNEAIRLREEAEARSAALKLDEERKLHEAEFNRLAAEQVARDLPEAKLKAEQDEEQAKLNRKQIQEAKIAEDQQSRQPVEQQARDIETTEQQAKIEAQEAERIKFENEQAIAEANAKRLSDEAREAKIIATERQEEQEAKDAEIAKGKRQDEEAEEARLEAESHAVESARLLALQEEQIARNVELSRRKVEEEAAEATRLMFEADGLKAESNALEVARHESIQAARDRQIKTLKDAEIEEKRLKAFEAAEHERAEIARVRALLEANEATWQSKQESRNIQPSRYLLESRPSKSVVTFPTGNNIHDISQSSRSPSSEPDTHENQTINTKTLHSTFDGTHDLKPEVIPVHEAPKYTLDQAHAVLVDSTEDSLVPHIRQVNLAVTSSQNSSTTSSGWSNSPSLEDVATIEANSKSSDAIDESSSSSLDPEPVFQFSNGVFLKQKNPDQEVQKQVPSSTSTDSRKKLSDAASTSAKALPSNSAMKVAQEAKPFPAGDIPIKDDSTSDSVSKEQPVSPLPAGYSASDPTPEIFDAEPASYFRPVISPVKTSRSSVAYSGPTTPTSSPSFSDLMSTAQPSPTFGKPILPKKSPRRFAFPQEPSYSPSKMSPHQETGALSSFDGAAESVPTRGTDMELHEFQSHSLARKTSITRINSPSQISISRRDSVSSNGSTVINSPLKDAQSSPRRIPSPIRPSTPTSPRNIDSFQEDNLSPSIRRHRNGSSHDYTSPDSPPPIPDLSKHSPIFHKREDSFSSISKSSDSPTTPTFTIDPSPAIISSPKKPSSDDQMQQQISNLLESIPARIRLTTESENAPVDSLNVKKTRRPTPSNLRSSSSMSNYSRAPTPSFTLAPAQAPRQRAQNGNPEIKVYHLSRSTGEAPIKLFVRLVGENGERVMVRVGGGWADLGEYLKEYASHHGRRAAIGENDKVEIQDLPQRIVSTGSSSSTATLRTSSSIANLRSSANGRSSPVSRPGSAMGFNRPASALGRPMSSLAIRKTRKSTGDSLDLPSASSTFRSPSTPMPSILSRSPISYETPPPPSNPPSAERERSSSRLSWAEEDSSLGLAGPKSKKIAISEKDQEWVESMKEKVRQASAEKERKARGSSFGEMDRIGGTKRLFRKKGM